MVSLLVEDLAQLSRIQLHDLVLSDPTRPDLIPQHSDINHSDLRQQELIIRLSGMTLEIISRQVPIISQSDIILLLLPQQPQISSISETGSMEMDEISV